MDIFDDPNFKRAFWEWFDSIPRKEREKFQLYKADMAELFFFNKIYKHRKIHEHETHNTSKYILER